MREMILDSCLGYIRGCLLKGIELESWELVQTNGLVWIENQRIGVRIRNKTKHDSLPAEVNGNEECNSSEEPTSKEVRVYMNDYRKAGLAGCDRAGTW